MPKEKTAKTDTDYSRCPGGFCELKEFHAGNFYFGIRYGCLGPKEGHSTGTDAHWVRQWSAWVCTRSWEAHREMAEQKKLPQTCREMIEHTKKFRASLRPLWMDRNFRGAA